VRKSEVKVILLFMPFLVMTKYLFIESVWNWISFLVTALWAGLQCCFNCIMKMLLN
jgi:hypothetical protein